MQRRVLAKHATDDDDDTNDSFGNYNDNHNDDYCDVINTDNNDVNKSQSNMWNTIPSVRVSWLY